MHGAKPEIKINFYCTFDTGKFHVGLLTAAKQRQDGTEVPS